MKPIYEKMTNAQLGAHLEKKIQGALTGLKRENNQHLLSHRFYDTKSAGSFLPEQPADYLIGSPTGAYLLEAKASFRKESLAACLSNAVSGGQAVHAKLWCRTGPNNKSLFVFFCAQTEIVEIWDGALVADTFIQSGARLSRADVMGYGSLSKLKDLLRRALL